MSRYGDSKVAKGVYRRITDKLDAGDKALMSMIVRLSELDAIHNFKRNNTVKMKSYRDKLSSLTKKVRKLKGSISEENIHLGDLLEAWSKIKVSIDRMTRRVEKFELKLIENKSIRSGVSEAAE